MDILITYWNSVWRSTVDAAHNTPHGPTADEWAAYERSLERDIPRLNPGEKVVSLDRRRAALQ